MKIYDNKHDLISNTTFKACIIDTSIVEQVIPNSKEIIGLYADTSCSSGIKGLGFVLWTPNPDAAPATVD